MDIVIYTTPEKLQHKRGLTEGPGAFYWYLSRPPKKFKEGDRVFFAVKGNVVGSFKSIEFNPDKDGWGDPMTDETIVWMSSSWKEMNPIPTTHFQGFKYRWF